jgi:hypothetical protein
VTWDSVAFPTQANWTAVCPHPTDSNTLYAAGKEYVSGIFMFAASTNAGRSWTSTKFSNINNASVSALAVSKTDPRNIVACGTTNGTWPNKYVLALLSSDGGISWQDISKSVSTSAVTDTSITTILSTVAIDPTDTNRIYLGGYDRLYTSTDGGRSWLNAAVPGVKQLAIDPRDPRNLCAFYAKKHPQYPEYYIGVYVSHDYGATWENHTDGFPPYGVSQLGTSGRVYFMPANPSNIAVSTIFGLTQSCDGGRHWTRASSSGMKFNMTVGMGLAPSRPSRIMVGTDCGSFLSDNGGEDWTELMVGGEGGCYTAFHPTDPNVVLDFGLG